jgi:hypothetical protein
MLQQLWEGFQLVVVVAFVAIFVLSKAAPGNPRLAWLMKFKLQDRRTDEQKRRARRSAQFMGGLQLIALGLALPLVYVGSTVILWGDLSSAFLNGTVAVAVLMVIAGITVIVKARTGRQQKGWQTSPHEDRR